VRASQAFISTADKKDSQGEEDYVFSDLCVYYCQPPSGIFAVVAGPKEAQGHTRNLLINSHNGNMLFSADGDQTVIGTDKLRVTGIPAQATCCYLGYGAHLLAWGGGVLETFWKKITLTSDVKSTVVNYPEAKDKD